MILQNAGVYSRQAIETVVTGGWSGSVTRALGFILDKEKEETWLRIRAEFALGYLQIRDPWVEEYLSRSCLHAWSVLQQGFAHGDSVPPRSHVTEMHLSLFALGDCFGVPGAEDFAKRVRERLRPVLTELASIEGDRALIIAPATRAAAYLLTVTAQPRENGERDLSEVRLENLSHHPDDQTGRLSRWALSFRFSPDGSVRSLLDAPA